MRPNYTWELARQRYEMYNESKQAWEPTKDKETPKTFKLKLVHFSSYALHSACTFHKPFVMNSLEVTIL